MKKIITTTFLALSFVFVSNFAPKTVSAQEIMQSEEFKAFTLPEKDTLELTQNVEIIKEAFNSKDATKLTELIPNQKELLKKELSDFISSKKEKKKQYSFNYDILGISQNEAVVNFDFATFEKNNKDKEEFSAQANFQKLEGSWKLVDTNLHVDEEVNHKNNDFSSHQGFWLGFNFSTAFIVFLGLFIAISVVMFICHFLLMTVDCLGSKLELWKKAVWIIFMLSFPLFGSITYYMVYKRNEKTEIKKEKKQETNVENEKNEEEVK